ncbi:MAG: STAS domain-containing protein [Actinomycetota bacterium]|nr:STAS domain-containing protein [Actinomycetota bacterium]
MEIVMGMDAEVVVIEPAGDLVASTAEQFKTQVAKLVEKNFRQILADLSKIHFMDSSGLGACIAIHKLVVERNGMIVFARPEGLVAKVFRITKIGQKLNVAATRAEALAGLHAWGAAEKARCV